MSNALNYGYGGWIPERTTTGVAPTVVRLVGWVAALSAAAFSSIGTGGAQSLESLQRSTLQAMHMTASVDIVEAEILRTPAENLARIREVLNPAISDLATTFGVSRQSVYNWLNGDAVAEDNAAKLEDLAQAADVLAHEGVVVNAALLKRKFANGKTLLQVAQAGESARNAAMMLVQIHKREAAQRERMSAKFANRAKTPASADFDLPLSSEQT